MRLPRRAIAWSLVLLSVVAVMPAAAAPDCDGGSIAKLRLASNRMRLEASITRPGATHASLVSPDGLHVEIVDPADGTVLFSADIPAANFVTRARTTKYDGNGDFRGSILLKDSRVQADTVRIVLRAARAILTGTTIARDVRAQVTAGGRCARTCAATCTRKGDGLRCAASDTYVPFADQGFGVFNGTRRTVNPLCGLAVDASAACDFLIDERCILPYPSSYFLKPDAATPTGLRVDYGPNALPQNTGGVHIDPTDWNTLDGFSPGPTIMALFPDTGFPVDLVASNVAFHTNFARSLDANHPTVLMKASTGERVLHFAEMDANTSDVTKKALIIRPGRRLEDATRYLVAIRDLVDTHGTPIRPRLAFRALRDGIAQATIARACGAPCAAAIFARQPAFASMFATLELNGVDPGTLVLAWDFTTASSEALTAWIVSVRDQAFALGTPTFTVDSVDDGGGAGRNANIFARIEGHFQAPLFMTADAPASRLNLVGGVPAQNGYANVPFVVDIPRLAWNGSGTPVPVRPTLWGHGLVGDRFQLGTLSLLANTYGFVIGAVDMQGMSSADVAPAILPLVQEFSKFHFIPERLHQGFLNHLLLGRLMLDPVNGFNSHPAFRFGVPATGIIDTTEVYYSGGSQGGIFGVAIMSIAEDFKRGFVAVPGANYSTLLHRSIDFNPYLALIRGSYPDRLDEQLLVALGQQLWDRAEPQGYMNHLLSGDLSTPPVPHKLLIHMATNDSEVSNLATQIMVRSLGITQLEPVHRSFFQIPEASGPLDSAFVEVDPQLSFSRCNQPGANNAGAACTSDADCPGLGDSPSRTRCDSGVPPLSNTPPQFNNRAHGSTGSPPMGQQIDGFLRPDGEVIQFCTGTCDPS